MDAVKFLKEIERMCEAHRDNPYGERDCKGCPLEISVDECMRVEMEEPEKIVEIVEQWSKEHPVKTYKDDFLEKFPNAKGFDDGASMAHWCIIYNKGKCKYGKGDGFNSCEDCWNEPMEEEVND